jgi:hypothetical protein
LHAITSRHPVLVGDRSDRRALDPSRDRLGRTFADRPEQLRTARATTLDGLTAALLALSTMSVIATLLRATKVAHLSWLATLIALGRDSRPSRIALILAPGAGVPARSLLAPSRTYAFNGQRAFRGLHAGRLLI